MALGAQNTEPIDSLPTETASSIPSYSLLPRCTRDAPLAAGFWHASDPSVRWILLTNLAKKLT